MIHLAQVFALASLCRKGRRLRGIKINPAVFDKLIMLTTSTCLLVASFMISRDACDHVSVVNPLFIFRNGAWKISRAVFDSKI